MLLSPTFASALCTGSASSALRNLKHWQLQHTLTGFVGSTNVQSAMPQGVSTCRTTQSNFSDFVKSILQERCSQVLRQQPEQAFAAQHATHAWVIYNGTEGAAEVTWPSIVGSQSCAASYMSTRPSSASALRKMGGGDSRFRATASQCFTSGCDGTNTCRRGHPDVPFAGVQVEERTRNVRLGNSSAQAQVLRCSTIKRLTSLP